MRVISVPQRLRLSSLLLLLTVPFLVFEMLAYSRRGFMSLLAWQVPGNLPFIRATVWVTAVGLAVAMITISAVLRGKKWVLPFLGCIAVIWVSYSMGLTLKKGYPSLGFATIFLLMYWTAQLLLLNRELSRTYLDPKIRWYQGLPEPIHFLGCEVSAEGTRKKFRVSQMDREGAFVFASQNHKGSAAEWGEQDVLSFFKTPSLDLEFTFQTKTFKCNGKTILLLDRVGQAAGAGIQFKNLNADEKKRLGEFVESVSGGGYFA